MALQNKSVHIRLLGSFFIICLLFLSTSMVVYLQNKKIGGQLSTIQEEISPHLINFSAIKIDIIQVQQWLTDVSATRGAEGYDDGFAEAEQFYNDAVKRIEFSRTEHQKNQEAEMVDKMIALQKSLEDYYRMGKVMARTYVEKGPDFGNKMMDEFDPFAEQLTSIIDDLVLSHEQEQKKELEDVTLRIQRNTSMLFTMSLVTLVLAVLLTVWLAKSIQQPLKKLMVFVGELRKGNLLAVCQLNQRDELGQMATSLTDYALHYTESITRIKGVSSSMNQSVHSLQDLSDKMGSSARIVSEKSRNMAQAVQQMDSNTQSIAAASEQASTNVNMVSSAVEEMSSTVLEIASKADDAITITENAVKESSRAENSVRELGQAAEDINKVTDTITEIADQTNLLALNATIEAARAGEAGKGFAVVANEIKDLASQTSEATKEISQRIDDVQRSTQHTVEVIKIINETISSTNNIVVSMATAIQEQAGVSKEISDNVSHVSFGIQEVNKNIGQMSVTYTDIAREINTINADTDEVEINCSNVNEQATELGSNQSVLRDIVDNYIMAEEPFDIGSVKNAHFQWKMKLSAAISGHMQIDSKTAPDHHQCDFGKWYASAPARLKSHPAFQEIDVHHKEVHRQVKEVLDLVASGKKENANKQLVAFELARKQLFQGLENLYAAPPA